MTPYSQSLQPLGENHTASERPEDEKLRILVASEQIPGLDSLDSTLKFAGYSIYHAYTGRDALLRCRSERPHLILLHRSLPDMNASDLIRELRKWISTPIIAISARDAVSEIIACFDSGANDYIKIPFAMGEVLARIRAALRGAYGAVPGEVLTIGDLRVNFDRREVFVGHQQVRLTATEYQLLNVLVRHAGVVRTHHQLIHEVWGTTQYQDAVHLLRVTVSNLRRKVATDSTRPIVTEPGVGYRLLSDCGCDAYARPN